MRWLYYLRWYAAASALRSPPLAGRYVSEHRNFKGLKKSNGPKNNIAFIIRESW